MGSQQRYVQSLAVTVHAFLPLAVAALLSVPVILGKGAISTEEVMSGGVLSSNLGILASDDASPAIRSLLQSLDFFSVWSVVLLVIGYTQTTRLSSRTVAVVVICAWALWILVRVGLGSLSG
jgi:hypothetical protein